jgi:hypothetical protein
MARKAESQIEISSIEDTDVDMWAFPECVAWWMHCECLEGGQFRNSAHCLAQSQARRSTAVSIDSVTKVTAVTVSDCGGSFGTRGSEQKDSLKA